MIADSLRSTVPVNNDTTMPAFGFGVWQMDDGEETERAVHAALEVGYRLIDTAKLYGNERSVGKAVRESGLPREEIFVTTKLWPTDFLNPESAFEKSFKRLGLEYIDLYLVHWPIPLMGQSVWRALEKVYKEKRVRAIGVSNYTIKDLEKLHTYAEIQPAVNQIKFSPFDYAKQVLAYCTAHKIVIEAYSPLTRGEHFRDKTIIAAAMKYGKSPAQIMLRWAVQRGTVPIPKSSRPERIRENAAIFDFEISGEDMQKLDSLT